MLSTAWAGWVAVSVTQACLLRLTPNSFDYYLYYKIAKELKNIFHPKIVTHLISEPSDALLYLDLTVLIHVTVGHNEILRSP